MAHAAASDRAPSPDQEKGIRRALFAGILANLGVAAIKFVAFLFTRSVAMLAESVHSVADSSNQALIFLGLVRSKKPATDLHPLGFNTERYFWSFVVAINIFVLGAVVAIYEGIHKIENPHPIDDPTWNYVALGVAALFEAYALSVAWKEFQHWREGATGSLWGELRNAKDLSLPTVLFEDSAALLGLLIAAIGIGLADYTHNGIYDGIASVAIGFVLLSVAWFLATESHSLLIGEAASDKDRAKIREIVEADEAVETLCELMTLQRGPNSVLVALVIDFHDDLHVRGLEDVIRRLESNIIEQVPAATSIFVEAGSLHRPKPKLP